MQTMTAPRSRLLAAAASVDVMAEYGAPVQLIQNQTGGNASVIFNDGTALHVKGNETIVFNTPIFGTISTDVNVTLLA